MLIFYHIPNMFGIKKRYNRIRREAEIMNVLVKHGFGYIADRINLQVIGKKKVSAGEEKIPVPVRARLVLEDLGPTFIKFGQILSMRPDLIPVEFAEEFKKLLDEVPPFEYEHVEKQIRGELGSSVGELFREFKKEPTAAASIGQVHNAKLKTDDTVVVKVQRPGIEDIIEADVEILFNIARLVTKHIPESRLYDPVGIVEEFARTIRRELDYTIEGRNADRLRKNFEGDDTVYIPLVYWDFTTRKVITMELVKGYKVSEIEKSLNSENRKKISENIAKSYMKQIFIDGFFHADPHPGNIFVRNSQIVLMDFGMVGRVDDYTKEKIANLFIAIIQKDIDDIIEKLLDIGMVSDETDIPKFRADITEVIEEYYGTSLQQVDIPTMLNNILKTTIRHKIIIPSNFILLIKTLVTMEGICREVDPEFNLTEISKPFVEALIKEKMSPRYLMDKFMKTVTEFNELLIKMPRKVDQILSKLETGDLVIDLEHKGLTKFISEMDTSSNRLSASLIISAIIVGSSIIMLTGKGPLLFGFPVFGIVGFAIAAILGMGLVISILRSGKF